MTKSVPCLNPTQCGVSTHLLGSKAHHDCIDRTSRSGRIGPDVLSTKTPPVSQNDQHYRSWALAEEIYEATDMDSSYTTGVANLIHQRALEFKNSEDTGPEALNFEVDQTTDAIYDMSDMDESGLPAVRKVVKRVLQESLESIPSKEG